MSPLVSEAGADGPVRLYAMGRHALYEALGMVGRGTGNTVLLPAFVCREVLGAVRARGMVPAFYPVNPDLTPASLPAFPSVSAVVLVNYFGFPQDIRPFIEYGQSSGAVVIEDNAHGYLSCDRDGHRLGTRGDLGLFSLRKSVPIFNGGALRANQARWIERLPAPIPPATARPPLGFRLKRILQSFQRLTGLPLRTGAESAVRQFRRLRTGNPLPVQSIAAEETMEPVQPILRDSIIRLERLDDESEIRRRRGWYERIALELAGHKVAPVFDEFPPGTAPYGFPFRAAEAEAQRINRVVGRYGFSCFRWPDLPTALVGCAPGFYTNVWWVNFTC